VNAADASRLAPRAARQAVLWLGPALIAGSVLFALRGFAFGNGLTNQHPDLLTFWLPRWSFLGDSIVAGQIPLWNPFEMAGYRFAADPQSGWLYGPPMLLFSLFSPGPALRLFIILNPVLAGLGMYAFLRKETLGRAGASAGGLALAMMMATSTIAISLPFAGALAWTTVLLMAASGYRSAERWSARLAWIALGAFAWMQVAAAHMSHGLVIATAFAIAYLAAGAVADARTGIVTARSAAARAALFVLVLPLAALPILVPHIDLLGESSLRGGYGALGDTGQSEVGDPLGSNGIWASWPLAFGAAPGAYAGAAALACVLLAARARRLRALVVAIGGLALAAYVLTSPLLVGASWFRTLVLEIPFGDVYLHNPGRLRYVAVLAVPILAAAGLHGLVEDPLSRRAAITWLGAAAFTFVVWPLLAGGDLVRFAMVAGVLLLVGPLLYGLGTRRWRWASSSAVVGVLTVELLASAVYAQSYEGGTIFTGLETGDHPGLVPQVLRYPTLDEAAYLAPTPIVDHIRAEPGRYATWAPPAAYFEKGYLWMKSPADWPALAPTRGTLFDIPDALGYNPVQLPRYWRYIRATNELSVFYNASVLNLPSVEDVRLLGLRYLVVPTGLAPPVEGKVVEEANGYSLWDLADAQPLATTSRGEVRYADDIQQALELATAPGFDPWTVTIAERSIGMTPPVDLRPVATTVDARSPTEIRIRLDPPVGGVLTVRNAYEAGWSATADGQAADTLPVDGFLQGVLLPLSTREVVLTYHDDAVMLGLALGAAVWAALLGAPLLALALQRGGAPGRSAPGGGVHVALRGLAQGRATPELALDETVDVAAEDTRRVTHLHVRPVVFHHLIRGEHVGTDLRSEVDGFPLSPELVHLLLALATLELGQAGFQDPHGHRAILELGSLVLAGDDDPGWQVRDADGRVGGVHRLAARSRRAVDVDPELFFGDLDLLFLGLLEERDHVEGRERRMSAFLGVERADPHEAMNPTLGRQEAVGVRPVQHERRGLDPRLLTVMDLVDLHPETLLLGPSRVHPEQHVGPVLRLGASGARLEGRDRVVIVVRP
jgi:hypothetical protein